MKPENQNFKLDIPHDVAFRLKDAENALIKLLPDGALIDQRWNDLSNLHTALTLLDSGYIYASIIHLQAILLAHGEKQAIHAVPPKVGDLRWNCPRCKQSYRTHDDRACSLRSEQINGDIEWHEVAR
jgi:hypothetical protein